MTAEEERSVPPRPDGWRHPAASGWRRATGRAVLRARRLARDAALWTGIGPSLALRRLVGATRRDAQRTEDVLIAPPGGGNVGDQAMVEAFLDATDGSVAVVTSSEDAIRIPARHEGRARVVCLPGLLYGTRRARPRDLRAFAPLLSRAREVAILGADVMDGLYQPRASVMRSVLAEAAVRVGADARVLGFSWPATPRAAARKRLAKAVKAGVLVFPRDPVSAARLRRDRIEPTRLVADVVFAGRASDRAALEDLELTGPYAVVNASGAIAREVDVEDDYAAIVRWMTESGLEVVVLPHVVGTATDDRVPSRALARRTGARMIDRMLTPAQVRGVVEAASVVVSGRMHLAILSLDAGVPAVSLATHGKVEGLMQMVGAPELCVVPRRGMADQVIALLESALPPGAAIRRTIEEAVPRLRRLAEGNFEGMSGVRAREEGR